MENNQDRDNQQNSQSGSVSGERPVRRRPLTEEEKAARAARRKAREQAGDSTQSQRRPLTEEEKAARAARRRAREQAANSEQSYRRTLTEEERAARAAARRKAREQVELGEQVQEALRAQEQEEVLREEEEIRSFPAAEIYEDEEIKPKKKKRKKKKRGLVIFLSVLLTLLLLFLALCVWELVGFRRDIVTPLSLYNEYIGQTPITLLTNGTANATGGTVIPTTQEPVATVGDATNASQTIEEMSAYEPETEEAEETTEEAVEETTKAVVVSTEAPTYQNDENGNLIIPQQQEGSFETAPAWESVLEDTGDAALNEANRLAAMYDYDAAIAVLQAVSGYESNELYTAAIADFEETQAGISSYGKNNTITHIFFHSLVVDTSRAFSHEIAISKQDDSDKVNAYNEVMTTVDEFVRIIEEMYERGYVLVSIYDIAEYTTDENGAQVMAYKPIYLPDGKIPFVLSVDDVSYYEYMDGHGFATRLVIGDDGKVTNEYVQDDGTVIRGSFDVMTILEDFIDTHPDFSYRGAKGTIALTGYEGILGYRTSDYWYNWNCDYFREEHAQQREKQYYNNENIEQDKQTAKEVAEAIKAQGWTFASHSWGHRDMGNISIEDLIWDTDMWEREVEPLIGETDIIIFPKGADIDSWRGYAADNEKYQKLKSVGFNYFCNVDSSEYWVQIGENKDYFRMGRRNLDGQRMWEALSYYLNPEGGSTDRISDLFDARLVFDWSRPTPVE